MSNPAQNIESSGKYTYGCLKINKWATNSQLIIGNFCSIATTTVYLDGNHDTQRVTTYPFGHIYQNIFNTISGQGHPLGNGNVVIGNDVWVADNVTIMSGITIGDGAVIANNSHVIKNVEPYTIVGGNPARYIKHRFSQEQIYKLLKIQWWYWDDQKINENLYLLCDRNIDIFINKFYNEL